MIPDKNDRKAAAVTAVLFFISVFVFSFLYYLYAVFSFSDVPGSDAYVYIIQVRSLIGKGSLHYRDLSPVYPFIAIFRIFSASDEISYRTALAAIGSLKTISVTFAAYSIINNIRSSPDPDGTIHEKVIDNNRFCFYLPYIAAAAGTTAVLASPTSLYMLLQFPKNSFAAAALFFAVGLFADGKTAAAIAAALISAASHRVCAGYIMLTAAFYIVLQFRFRHLLMFFTAVSAVLLLLSMLMPGALNFFDIERLTSSFSPTLTWPPAGFAKALSLDRNSLYWNIENNLSALLMIFSTGCLMFSHYRKRSYSKTGLPERSTVNSRFTDGKDSDRTVFSAYMNRLNPAGIDVRSLFLSVSAASVLTALPLFSYSPEQTGFRLFLQSMSAAPLYTALVVSLLYVRFCNSPASGGKDISGKRHVRYTPAVILFSLILLFSVTVLPLLSLISYKDKHLDPPYAQYKKLAAKTAELVPPETCDLYVAHKMLAETMDFVLDADVLPWSPEKYFNRKRTWRIVWMITKDQILNKTGSEETVKVLSPMYTLVREDVWEDFCTAVGDDPFFRDILESWKNPSKVRPAYLSRQK